MVAKIRHRIQELAACSAGLRLAGVHARARPPLYNFAMSSMTGQSSWSLAPGCTLLQLVPQNLTHPETRPMRSELLQIRARKSSRTDSQATRPRLCAHEGHIRGEAMFSGYTGQSQRPTCWHISWPLVKHNPYTLEWGCRHVNSANALL